MPLQTSRTVLWVLQTVRMMFSGPSRLTDIIALMDSYGIELWQRGLLFLRAPLPWCEYVEYGAAPRFDGTIPAIDDAIEIRLVRFEPPTEGDVLEGIRERQTRWPFFVESPLEIWLATGDQWWCYQFSPGKTYEERRFDRTANARPPEAAPPAGGKV